MPVPKVCGTGSDVTPLTSPRRRTKPRKGSGAQRKARMMSEHFFGLGTGHLPQTAAAIAKKHGAVLVNYTDPQCKCGHGCPAGKCKASRRHWFACPNRGQPFDGQTAAAVLAAIEAAATANTTNTKG